MMQRDYRSAWIWHMVWLCVFAANLPLPVLLGCEFGRGIQVGMIAGVLVWWIVSHLMFDQIPCLRGALICGGAAVALSQVGGVLHVVVGFVAAHAVVALDVRGDSFAAGFWLTIFTGSELMVVAVHCGGFVWTAFKTCSGRT